MAEKECFKCKEVKPLDDFYRHPQMADGHVNKCKSCNKLDVRKNRTDKIEHYRAYDRKRGNRLTKEWLDDYHAKFPKKTRAQRLVAYHVRKGTLVRESCGDCGSDFHVHAHHDDYDKPLNVRWLCAACHHQWHAKFGEAKNAQ